MRGTKNTYPAFNSDGTYDLVTTKNGKVVSRETMYPLPKPVYDWVMKLFTDHVVMESRNVEK